MQQIKRLFQQDTERLELEQTFPEKSKKNWKIIILVAVMLIILLLILLIIILVVVNNSNSSSKNDGTKNFQEKWKNYRLSNTTVPEFYTLTLKPFITEGTFQGNVSITVNIREPENVIYLHIFNLNVTETKLWKEKRSGENVKIKRSFEYPENEYWVVEMDEKVDKGIYILDLSFEGSLTLSIVGFYRSVYTNRLTNKTCMLATTKFEPTYARRAFPCFDEPNKKANYSVTVVHNATQHPVVLSNMPQKSSVLQSDGWRKTSFETSIKMSTYLVCFIISDFDFLENRTKNGIKMRTYAPSDRVNDTKFALDVATKLLDYYDDYFDIPYKLSINKLDLVSIPDFVSGAMENWGVITFRQTNLLYTEGKGSADRQERVAYVVCHELAHMWFGNVVTMDWWDDLWLNEGFATWIGYVLAMNYVNPEWNGDTKFLTERLQTVMVKDGADTSHPIIMPLWHPHNFTSAFDAITYNKGAAVIRMLEDYLTRDVFKKGIREYMKKYMYSNAKTDDLWEVLSNISGKNVKNLMHAWTLQPGFPVVVYNNTSTELKQERFYSNPNDAKGTNFNQNHTTSKWIIPVTSRRSDTNETDCFLMDTEKMALNFSSSGKSSWTKLNDEEKGFYRVNYAKETWEAMINQLTNDHTVFTAGDRTQLIDDSFRLAGAGLLDYDIPLKLVKYIKKDTRNEPWYTFQLNIWYMDKMLRTAAPETYRLLSKYIKSLSEPVLAQLGWEDSGEMNNRKKLRNYVVRSSCRHNVEICTSNVTERFEKWIQNESFWISSNYRRSVFKYGMQKLGTMKIWNTVWNRYLVAMPEDKYDLAYALAKTSVPWILNLYIKLAENESYVRSQDFFTVMAYISANPVGNPIVYAYVKENWLKLVERFSISDRYLGRLLPSIVSGFNSKSQLEDVKAFFDRYPEAGAGADARKQAISSIRRNIEWVEKNVEKIHLWLTNKYS